MSDVANFIRQFIKQYNFLSYLFIQIILFIVYFTTATVGLRLDPVGGFATLVWPPTGIALSTMLLFGYRVWPAIALGAFFVNLNAGAPPLVAAGIATGNALEAYVGTYVLTRILTSNYSLSHLKNVAVLIVCAAFGSTLVSATIGTISLLLGNSIAVDIFASTWIAWWIGDMLGNLIVTPFILVWSQQAWLKTTLKRIFEALIATAVFIGITWIVFQDFFGFVPRTYPLTYLVFPPLMWIAFRFHQRVVVTTILLLSIIAIWSTATGSGPFASQDLSTGLLFLQIYLGVVSITTLLFSAIVAERKKLEQHKDEFLALASHELKTPITSSKLFTEYLQRRFAKRGDHEAAGYLARLDMQMNRLARIVQNLLDISRFETGKLTYQKEVFLLDALIAETIGELNIISPKHTLRMVSHSKQHVKVDPERIRQVLTNLITNAIRYSTNASMINIGSKSSNKFVIVWVQDFGIGIPKSKQNKIFDRFYQVNTPQGKSERGLGIGLYICKEIIQQHGGTIWVESTEGRGSTFYFTLPVHKPLRNRIKKVMKVKS